MNQTGKLPAIFAAVVGGSFMAVQARVNSGLGQEIGSGILAALVSFSIGLLIISVATLASSKNRAALSFTVAKFKDSSIPLWLSVAGML
ncbi:MAG: putative inner rane exporter, YdcZ, partial [Actinomycetota bacterium]